MIRLIEYFLGPRGLQSRIPCFSIFREGIIYNKNGSLTAGFLYSGPDMESSLGEEHTALCDYVNKVLMKLGSGWTINFNKISVSTKGYPQNSEFNSTLFSLIDQKRRIDFENEGDHHKNLYGFTLTYKPQVVESKRFFNFFVRNESEDKEDIDVKINKFEKVIFDVANNLASKLDIHYMSSQELIDYFNLCLTGNRTKIVLPETPMYLNHLLGSYDFVGASHPQIDGKYIKTVALTNFPQGSDSVYSGMLDVLNNLPFEFRFSSRFIILDQSDGNKYIEDLRNTFFTKQFDFFKALMKQFVPEEDFGGKGAVNAHMNDLDYAKTLNDLNKVKFGYYTATVVIFDKDENVANEKALQAKALLERNGFMARVESWNCVDAFFGSLPGNIYENVRKPVISTASLSRFIQLTSIWPGHETSPCKLIGNDAPPMFMAASLGSTPFHGNIHEGDVGHTAILGPTGSGKSTLISFLVANFDRYKNSQVFIFDKKYSQYIQTKAAGGIHHDIYSDHDTTKFCPFQNIDNPNEMVWAKEWIETLIQLQGLEITPSVRKIISTAMTALKDEDKRTLSNFHLNVQSEEIKDALEPFLNGILDGEEENFELSNLVCFECDHLLQKKESSVTPIFLYIFHLIESKLHRSKPTLIIMDEWVQMLKSEVFVDFFQEKLRELRKLNASMIFATQSLADIEKTDLKPIILESCRSKFFLPNPSATNQALQNTYVSFGLNKRQITLIAKAVAKRHYYYSCDSGNRLIELGLGSFELAFMGAADHTSIDMVRKFIKSGRKNWVGDYLRSKNLEYWAEAMDKMSVQEVAYA